jgi:hypothetical protein
MHRIGFKRGIQTPLVSLIRIVPAAQLRCRRHVALGGARTILPAFILPLRPALLSIQQVFVAVLLCAGTGPLEAELRRQVHKRGLRVEVEGYCAVDPLAELNRNSAFSVAPSEFCASFVRYCCSTAIIPILQRSFPYWYRARVSDGAVVDSCI